MLESSKGGNDTLQGGNNDGGILVEGLAGDAAIMLGSSKGGNDTLRGGINSDGTLVNVLVGDAVNMLDHSKGGNDTLWGSNNDGTGIVINHLYGDARNMSEAVEAGNDRLISGSNATDHMYGDAKNLISNDTDISDFIASVIDTFGVNQINAFLQSGGSEFEFDSLNDIVNDLRNIFDSNENSILTSPIAGGADIFAFNDRFGNDFIHDFRQSDRDRIEFSVTGVGSFDDLEINDDGSDTIITVEGHGTVTLVGFTGVNLVAENFIFSS